MDAEKDPRVYLKDILEYCDRILANVASISLEDFQKQTNLQDAVIRQFEVVGEAIKRVPADIRDRYPQIEWKNAAAFRDVLAHDYPEIIIDTVYNAGKNNIPVLRQQIQKILDDLG